jgi:hypothetical protein
MGHLEVDDECTRDAAIKTQEPTEKSIKDEVARTRSVAHNHARALVVCSDIDAC